MNDQQLIKEDELPATVPPTDAGWSDMLKRLDDEMPEGVVPVDFNTGAGLRKCVRMLLVLLFLLLTWIVAEDHTKNITAIISGKQKITAAANNTNGIKISSSTAGQKNNNGTDNAGTGEQNLITDQTEENSLTTNSVTKKNITADNKTEKNNSTKTITGITASSKKKKATNSNTRFNTAKTKNKRSFANDHRSVTEEITAGEVGDDESKIPGTADDTAMTVSTDTLKATAIAIHPSPLADSTPTDTTEKDPEEKQKGWTLQTGLQWNVQLPTVAGSAYFQGPGTTSQPWRIVLPGVWLQAVSERKLLTLEVNPFFTNLVPAKNFSTITTATAIPDTFVTTTQTKTLRKLFGISAGVGYDVNVSGNWWLGGNLQACWYTKAIAVANSEITKTPSGGGTSITSSFRNDYPVKEEWSYFSKFQFYLYAEALYKNKKGQAGFRAGIAATPLAKQDGPANPVRLELFYRMKLYNWKVKIK